MAFGMKINFFCVLFYKIIFVLITNLSFSQNSENYFKAGNDFYNNGQFEKALDSYFKVLVLKLINFRKIIFLFCLTFF